MSNMKQYLADQRTFNDQTSTLIKGLRGDAKALADAIEALRSTPGAVTPNYQSLLDTAQSHAGSIVTKLSTMDPLKAPVPPTDSEAQAAYGDPVTARGTPSVAASVLGNAPMPARASVHASTPVPTPATPLSQNASAIDDLCRKIKALHDSTGPTSRRDEDSLAVIDREAAALAARAKTATQPDQWRKIAHDLLSLDRKILALDRSSDKITAVDQKALTAIVEASTALVAQTEPLRTR